MTDLKDIQGLFQNAVMGGGTDFLDHIEEGGKISPERRLHIYQHAYRARLREVLEEDFPVTHSMLGDEAFHELGNRYIAAYPSAHPSLRYFGQNFETYVRNELPYKDMTIIGEMAHFEWIFHDVFDASDHDIVSVEDVAALPSTVWTTLRFAFHPSFHMSAYEWNVAAVWSSVQEDPDRPVMPEKMPVATNVIQWRRDLRSYFRTVEYDEGQALLLALDGKAFPEICEFLAEDHFDNAPMRAAELLKTWVTEGLIGSLNCLNLKM